MILLSLDASAPSSLAGVITAAGVALTAVSVVITAVTGFLVARRATNRVESKIDTVHVIVNQQRTDLQNYNRALQRALRAAGLDVPEDQSQE